MLAAQQSAAAQLFLGSKSLYQPRGSQALAPFHIDDTSSIDPIDSSGVAQSTWGGDIKVRFSLPKTASLIGQVWLEWTMGAGVSNPAYTPAIPAKVYQTDQAGAVAAVNTPQCAYVKNIGDLFWKTHILRYGQQVLQQYDTEFVVINRRLCKNDVNIEHINVNVLGGLPAGGAGEQVRIDMWYNGGLLRCPLEELYFVHHQDEYWMPEALALEGTLEFITQTPSAVFYTRTGAVGVVSTLPTFGGCKLRYQEITISAAEKSNRLALYKSPEGHVIHFLDIEKQTLQSRSGTGAGGVTNVSFGPFQLNNFRMDMAEIVFCVRAITASPSTVIGPTATLTGQLQPYKGDPLESNTANSLITQAPVACVMPIVSFTLQANGKDIYTQTVDELWNRSGIRKHYHPDSQVADGYYCIPFARYPEDRKNVTGFKSAAALGNLTLTVTMLDPGSAYSSYGCDVWCHSHNIIQMRAGGAAKLFN